MKVEDPSGKLNDLATQVIAKAKTALAATTLTSQGFALISQDNRYNR
jgi:hypothetical protein